jgi:hypothetical protein
MRWIAATISVLCLLFVASAVRAQGELTLDNFNARYTAKSLADIDFGPFDCGPDIFDRANTFCFNETRIVGVNANVFMRGKTSSRVLTYTSVLVPNPEETRHAGLFLALCLRMVATLSPELSTDAIMQLLLRITRVPNSEQRVGAWVYKIERGALTVALHARRK